MQILWVLYETGASLSFGVHGGPGTSLLGVPRDDGIHPQYSNIFCG